MSPPPFRPPVPEPLHPFGAFRPPGEFSVTQRFDDINPEFPVPHRALDLGNGRLGGNIVAPAPGVILDEGWLTEPWSESSDRFGTGNYGGLLVVIQHDNGYISALAHMADTIVNAGQRVLDGQLLGHLGETGSAKGRGHVHWDLYHGRPTTAMTYAQRVALKVDPWPLLRQNYRLADTATAPEDDMATTITIHPLPAGSEAYFPMNVRTPLYDALKPGGPVAHFTGRPDRESPAECTATVTIQRTPLAAPWGTFRRVNVAGERPGLLAQKDTVRLVVPQAPAGGPTAEEIDDLVRDAAESVAAAAQAAADKF